MSSDTLVETLEDRRYLACGFFINSVILYFINGDLGHLHSKLVLRCEVPFHSSCCLLPVYPGFCLFFNLCFCFIVPERFLL